MTGISSEINLFEHKIPVMLTLTGIEALKRSSGYLHGRNFQFDSLVNSRKIFAMQK